MDTQGAPVGQNLVSRLFQMCSLVDTLGLSLCGLDSHSPLGIEESWETRSGLVVKSVKRPGIAAEGGFLLPFQPALTQCLAVDQHWGLWLGEQPWKARGQPDYALAYWLGGHEGPNLWHMWALYRSFVCIESMMSCSFWGLLSSLLGAHHCSEAHLPSLPLLGSLAAILISARPDGD